MGVLREAARSLARDREPLPESRLGQPDAKLRAHDVLEALNGPARMWSYPEVLPELYEESDFLKADKIQPVECAREHTESLRRYVDLWLATGRKPNGIENASERKPTNGIHRIVQEFYKTHHVTPVPLRDGYTVATTPRVDWQTLGDANTVDSVVLPDPKDSWVSSIIQSPPRTVRRRGRPEKPFNIAEDAAQRMFVGMLLSDWRLKIAKCCKCAVYFLLSHPKRTFENGTHCAKCGRKRSQGSAKKATWQARKDAARTLWMLAAKRFKTRILRVADWNHDPRLRSRIVEFLNGHIAKTNRLKTAYPRGITLKWLSWSKNQDGITEALRGERNAKG